MVMKYSTVCLRWVMTYFDLVSDTGRMTVTVERATRLELPSFSLRESGSCPNRGLGNVGSCVTTVRSVAIPVVARLGGRWTNPSSSGKVIFTTMLVLEN